MKKLYYSVRNFLWYRHFRHISRRDYNHIKSTAIIMNNPKRAAAELLLFIYGLQITNQDALNGIYLTRAQKLAILVVEKQGYAVGLK